jgi:hypothetical protein
MALRRLRIPAIAPIAIGIPIRSADNNFALCVAVAADSANDEPENSTDESIDTRSATTGTATGCPLVAELFVCNSLSFKIADIADYTTATLRPAGETIRATHLTVSVCFDASTSAMYPTVIGRLVIVIVVDKEARKKIQLTDPK